MRLAIGLLKDILTYLLTYYERSLEQKSGAYLSVSLAYMNLD